MARPRTARVIGPARYTKHDDLPQLPAVLREVLDEGDPAFAEITHQVLRARLAGEDLMDEQVAGRCVAHGRLAHAAKLMGHTA